MHAFRDHAVSSPLRLAVLVVLLVPLGVWLGGAHDAVAQTLGPPAPSTIREGTDFATFVLGQPWDMKSEPYPDFPTVLFGYDRPASTVSNGNIWTITTNTADAGIRIHAPGLQQTQKVLKLGDRFPIDAFTYNILSFQLCSTALSTAQILWFTQQDPQVGSSIGQSVGFTVVAGCRIYVMDLSNAGILLAGAPWSGAITSLRIDPTNSAAGIVLSLDWIRLTTNDLTNVVSIPWSGAGGGNQVDFFLNRTCSLTGAMRIGRRNTGAGTFQWGAALEADPTQGLGTATPLPLPESFEPGVYTLFMQVNTGPAVGCQAFTIQRAPILTFFKPSFFSGPDYATLVRGKAWDMTDPSDIASTNDITSLSFAGGEAVGVTGSTGDPVLYLATPSPIDASRYKYATFQYALEGFQDIGAGSVQRLFWWFSTIGVDSVVTRDMIIYEGYHTYSLDLTKALLEPPPSTLGPGWTGTPSVFRFDPDEFASVKVFHLQYLTLTGDDRVTAGQDFPIRYTRTPGAPQPSFYFDPDNDPNNANHFIIALSGASCPADPTAPGLNLFLGTECFMGSTAGVPAGTYYIRGELDDGLNFLAARYGDVPVIVRAGGGTPLSLVIRGTDNAIRHNRFDGVDWTGFVALPGATADIPALASSGGGILDLVVRGIDNSVYHNHFNGSVWGGFVQLPGATADIPALAASGGGILDLVVRGTDNGIYHAHYNGATWSNWTALPGATASIPALAASGGGILDLVVRGIDNGVYHAHYEGGIWSDWTALPGATADIPALAASGGGILDLVVRGIDNGVYHAHYEGGIWSGWIALPGATADIPSLAASGGGVLDLVVRGIDNGVYHAHYDGATWSNWVALTGATASIPALAASGGGALDLAVRGTDNGVYHNHYDGATWSGWTAVGGTTASRPALVVE
jgi:hypothetical protein